ncbi:MAG: sugar-binding transcriptional regulator [Anaerolineae bacterium]|nr:sugar-binding transcriptional regulator [Anaerolineae bacterium]
MAVHDDDVTWLLKIAKAYYEDGLTQAQVGKRLGISRVKVSRLLQQARDKGIVQITVVAPEPTTSRLERGLELAYGLDEAIVVAPSRPDSQTVIRELGAAAAQALVRCLPGCRVLGLTWGTTLLSVVDALPVQHWPELRVCQLLGGLGQPEAEVYGADLARRTAEALGARLRLLPAPGIVSSRLVRDGLLSDPQIADTLALGASADVGLVGIGQPGPSSVVVQSGILTAHDLRLLQEQGAVGDIALRFFDAQGQPVEHEINERIIGPTLEQIRGIPRTIGVAGGPSKRDVIRAALCGGLLDVLVTDEATAAVLLSARTGDTRGSGEIR